MVRKAEEMMKEIKRQMRGGNGSVELLHIFGRDELAGKARLFARITLKPGCSIGRHEHVAEEEIFYVIEGKGIVNDNGTEREVVAGDAMLTGDGSFHSVENRETAPLVMLAAILLL